MTALENFASPAFTRALGWTLLHSLWQGALVAAVLAGALLLLRRQRAQVRYVASAAALGAVVALAGITFGLYFSAGASQVLTPATGNYNQIEQLATPPTVGAAASAGMPAAEVPAKPAARAQAAESVPALLDQRLAVAGWLNAGLRYFDQHLPALVVAWLLGLLAMSLRMLGGLLYVQRLRRHRVRPLGTAWQQRFAALAARSGVRRPVALLESALVRVPLVVGHLRPVILLPLGAVAGLSPACLEAILAHELAHVLRRDYLVNLLQTVAEALFFYHPAVWFVANCVRTERENCCDDTATALCGGNPLRLAHALTSLAEWSQSAVVPGAPQLALAAMGRRGALLGRVRRLVQQRPAAPTLGEGLMAGALVLSGLGLLGGSVALARPFALPATALVPAWQTAPAKAAGANDTTKKGKPTTLTTTSTTTTATTKEPSAAVAPLRPPAVEDVVRSETGVRAAAPDRSDDAPPRHKRRPGQEQRVVIGRNHTLAPPAFGRAGTVVITKDKKGRLTDLVVDGQRIDTKNAKGKVKIKTKGDYALEQGMNVIRLAPPAPDARAYVYRSEGGSGEWFEPQYPNHYRLRSALPDQRFNRDFHAGQWKQLSELGELQKLTPLNGKVYQLRAAERTPASPRVYRLNGTEMVELDGTMQDRLEEVRERQEEVQRRREELRERIRESQHELRELDHSRAQRTSQSEDVVVAELLKDGLIQDRNNFQVRLNSASLVVNGKEQPAAVYQKYRKLYESTTGRKMTATSSMSLTRNSDSRTDSYAPRPPREPRAPRAPRAPAVPQSPGAGFAPTPPAPPAPPLPPRFDTPAIRSELRKDGLLGPDVKNFQLQLNGAGLTVNGKPQPEALAAKYRKLMGYDRPGQVVNVNISEQE